MSQEKDKYSLWIVPKGEFGEEIQTLVDKLADENDAPRFVPHLTLVANIFADPQELEAVASRIKQCTEQIGPFAVKLAAYGYSEEEFRCLYVLAEGEGIKAAYKVLSEKFPQIFDEHFQVMPHMSVLYGTYPQVVKDEIVAANPLMTTEFTVDTFDLYLTNDPVESWQLTQSFALSTDI